MRRLYLVHRIPFPPDKGDKIRSYRWLEHLARHHEVHLVTLIDDPADAVHVPRLEEICASVSVTSIPGLASKFSALSCMARGRPLSLGWFHQQAAQRAVDEVLAKHDIDAVFCYSSTMAEYVFGRADLVRVMDMVDVDSAKFETYARYESFPKSAIYRMEASRLGRYEERIAREFEAVILCTEPEAEMLRNRVPGAKVPAIGNGAFLPEAAALEGREPSHRMIFVGAMDYFANVDAVVWGAREVLPLVREQIPDAEYHIVGRDPTPAVRALAELPGVIVHGGVPSLEDHLRGAALSLVPLRIAQGIQNKVLEAMSWELPVVTTPRIVHSLGATEGRECASGDDPAALAKQCVRLLRDREAARAMGKVARAFVGERFSWEREAGRIEELLESLTRVEAEA